MTNVSKAGDLPLAFGVVGSLVIPVPWEAQGAADQCYISNLLKFEN